MLQRGAELVIHHIRAAQGLGTEASSGWTLLMRGRQPRATSLWEQALRSRAGPWEAHPDTGLLLGQPKGQTSQFMSPLSHSFASRVEGAVTSALC